MKDGDSCGSPPSYGPPSSGRMLLPAPPYVVREGFILAYREDLFQPQVVRHRQGAHPDPVQLVVGLHIQHRQHAPLPADLVEPHHRAGLFCRQRRLGLLLPALPQLRLLHPLRVHTYVDEDQHGLLLSSSLSPASVPGATLLRGEDGTEVARFSVWEATRQAIEQAAQEDRRTNQLV